MSAARPRVSLALDDEEWADLQKMASDAGYDRPSEYIRRHWMRARDEWRWARGLAAQLDANPTEPPIGTTRPLALSTFPPESDDVR